jgi:glucosylceramidase
MSTGRISGVIAAATLAAACGSNTTGGDTDSSTSSSPSTSASSSVVVGTSTVITTSTSTLADGGIVTTTGTSTFTTSSTVSATGSGSNSTGSGTTTSSGSASTSAVTPAQTLLITSGPGAYWQTNGTLTTATSGNATVTVNDGTAMQTFQGFGGAFNEDGWSYLSMLSATDSSHAIQLLFDAANGAHFVMGRIPMGASDYATSRYTDDETSGDTAMKNFSISRDMMYLIPYVKAAQGSNSGLTFWGSPWTPPTWMKTTSGSVSGTSCKLVGSTMFDGGCMMDVAANLTGYAQYFVKWIQAYAAQGITIGAIAPQNEPNYAQGYPSALWTPALYTKFIDMYLSPALSAANLNTKIMLGTMSNGDNGQQSLDLMVVTNVMADSMAKNIVKLVGLQWGMLDIYEQNPSWLPISGLPVWATEHKCGNYPWNPAGSPAYVEPAPNDQAYGVESWGYIRNAIKAGVTAYNAWNMVLDVEGKGNDTTRQWSQDSLLVVNTSSKTLTITPAYYVFRHVSQYVQPGATVVATSGGDAIAFKNPDGTIVTVMYNSGAASTYTLAVGGKKLQFAMPSNGWATVDYVP